MPSPQPLTLTDRVISIQRSLPGSVRLIAVSKYMPTALIREAYDAGLRDFGESRVQEAIQNKQSYRISQSSLGISLATFKAIKPN